MVSVELGRRTVDGSDETEAECDGRGPQYPLQVFQENCAIHLPDLGPVHLHPLHHPEETAHVAAQTQSGQQDASRVRVRLRVQVPQGCLGGCRCAGRKTS